MKIEVRDGVDMTDAKKITMYNIDPANRDAAMRLIGWNRAKAGAATPHPQDDIRNEDRRYAPGFRS